MTHLFMLRDQKAKGATPTVDRLVGVKRTLLPREVDCPDCLEWIARNYKAVIAQVEQLRRLAA